MVATKKSKAQPTLRQSTLSFASKRAHSSNIVKEKKAPIRKTGSAPVSAPSEEGQGSANAPDHLEISSDSDDETEIEFTVSKSVKPTPPAVEEVEREHLNPNDRKWNKHYASVKRTMGGLPAGERSPLETPYLADT